MRHLTASQKIALLENRVAQLEKQAILNSLKRKAYELLNNLIGILRRPEIIYGASERDIKKAMKKLEKDPEFEKVLEKAPKRGNIKKMWSYFNIYFKRVLGYSGKILIILVLGAILMKLLSTTAFAAGILLTFFFKSSGSFGPDEYYAKEIAKQRLLDIR